MVLGRQFGGARSANRRRLAVVVAVGLLASGCGLLGSDDAPSATPAANSPDPAAATLQGAEAASGVGAAGPDDGPDGDEGNVLAIDSIDDLEARWAEQRAAVVARIRSGGYGIGDDGVLSGPGGFELDLDRCPSGWNDAEALGDTIPIGYTTARSGNLAPYGYVADGMAAYFDYVNSTGGIGGRQLELVIEDDEYKADRTVDLVEQFVAEGSVFAVTTLGYPGTVAVMDRLNEACVPQPFAVTSHPVWGDPENHPWTTGLQMAHSTEAVLWGNWIKANLAAELPVKVAALVRDDAFGVAYESSFRAWADANPDVVAEFVPVTHDTAPGATVSGQLSAIAAAEPDVFISMTAGSSCLLAVQEAGRVGLASIVEVQFAPSVCRDPAEYMIPAGEAADGWHIVGGGIKATTDPRYAGEPFISFTNTRLAEAGLDPAVGFYGTCFATYGWPLVEVLRIAAELDGGLTRSNLVLAQRAMDLEHPILLAGVRFAMEGAVDSFPVEGSNFGVFDAATQTWVEDSPVIDVDGSTPNCAWTTSGC